MQRTGFTITLLMALFAAPPTFAQDTEAQRDYSSYKFAWHQTGGGFIGVQVVPMTPELRRHFGAPEDVGVLVSRVEETSPAEAAGIRVGDILAAVDGQSVESGRKLSQHIRNKKEGETVSVELYRDGGLESYPIVVAERERPVLDLAGGYRFIGKRGDMGDGEAIDDHDIFIATPGLHVDGEALEAFREAMKGLEDRFESDEWQDRLERFRSLDLGAIQERMQEVEKRLEELEEELSDAGKEKF